MQILSHDMVRRLFNIREELGAANRGAMVDKYAKKLLQSGYTREQTKKLLLNGIKGFEKKRRSRLARGEKLRSTAKMSRRSRLTKKLLSKTNWYRKKGSSTKEDTNGESSRNNSKKGAAPTPGQGASLTPQTMLFVEYSKGGEIA